MESISNVTVAVARKIMGGGTAHVSTKDPERMKQQLLTLGVRARFERVAGGSSYKVEEDKA